MVSSTAVVDALKTAVGLIAEQYDYPNENKFADKQVMK